MPTDTRENYVRTATKHWRPLAAATALALIAAACGGDDGGGDGEAGADLELADEGEFTILHAFTGEEDTAGLNAIIAGFNEQYPDITVRQEGSNDFEALARTRVGAGNAPDIMLHPQPGLLEDFVAQGVVQPLEFLDVGEIDGNMVGGLSELGTFDDTYYAQAMRLSLKSLVWFNPATFEANGYEVPETWDDMMALSDTMVADGIAPWCIGIESGDATGWVATDWVEDIVLRTAGPDAYDQWVAGELEFASDEIQGAIEEYMVPIWTNDDYVFGGRDQIAREAFGSSVIGILGDDPECGLHRQATFIEGFITESAPDAVFGEDYDFFYLPGIEEEFGNPAMGGGDFAALYTDNGAAARFIEYLSTPESGEPWAAEGGFLSPFAPVFDDSVYPSDSAVRASEILAEADSFRFDASDLMPGDVGSSSASGSFWIEMTNWVTGSTELSEALANIDALYASQ
jgi:alpha-glucoside transport system substrate-binding protein